MGGIWTKRHAVQAAAPRAMQPEDDPITKAGGTNPLVSPILILW